MKRIQNGDEDNVYHYTAIAVKNYMNFDGDIPNGFLDGENSETDKAWWKFW